MRRTRVYAPRELHMAAGSCTRVADLGIVMRQCRVGFTDRSHRSFCSRGIFRQQKAGGVRVFVIREEDQTWFPASCTTVTVTVTFLSRVAIADVHGGYPRVTLATREAYWLMPRKISNKDEFKAFPYNLLVDLLRATSFFFLLLIILIIITTVFMHWTTSDTCSWGTDVEV